MTVAAALAALLAAIAPGAAPAPEHAAAPAPEHAAAPAPEHAAAPAPEHAAAPAPEHAVAPGAGPAARATAQLPAPERGVAVVVEPVRGPILVREDGAAAYRPLSFAERLPVGTTVDAQDGRARLIVARDDDGATWSAEFSRGKFTVTQPARGAPVTTLKLTGPSFRDTCGAAAASAPAGRKRKRVRRLWGDGHGRFRTEGHYSAATVRGTSWQTIDRCDGTVTRVLRGAVAVEDFTAPPPETGPPPPGAPAPGGAAPGRVVRAGGSYVARPGR